MKNQFFTKIYLKQDVYNNLTLFNKNSLVNNRIIKAIGNKKDKTKCK